MSMQHHPQAVLRGWEGPIYPQGIGELVDALENLGSYGPAALDAVCQPLPGYIGARRGRTADKYLWYWMLVFTTGYAQVLVAIPWSQDWERADGCQFDRSPAVYYGEVAKPQVDAILQRLIVALRDQKSAE